MNIEGMFLKGIKLVFTDSFALGHLLLVYVYKVMKCSYTSLKKKKKKKKKKT